MTAPPAPPRGQGLRDALDEGLRGLGLDLPPQACGQLLAHLDLIQRWTRVYNLTAVREPMAMLTQHLLDSLAAVPALRRHAAGRPLRLLDVGSGAGLPGLSLAIACPDLAVSCVDTVGKKALFIRQVAAELGLRQVEALHGRVEALPPRPWDLITARAYATLADLVRDTGALLHPEGVWMAYKGRRPDAEIEALPQAVEVFHVEPLVVPGLDAARCLVWMRRRPSSPAAP